MKACSDGSGSAAVTETFFARLLPDVMPCDGPPALNHCGSEKGSQHVLPCAQLSGESYEQEDRAIAGI